MSENTHKINVLSGIEAIQLRPGMYIGDNSTPDHLVQEVLDNAVDELMESYADEIHVTIDNETHSVIVIDNGRGIPVHTVKLEHGNIVDSIITACTTLHSGSKFKNSSYKFSGGMNGVGLVAVNALSKELDIAVVAEDILHKYRFENGKFISHDKQPVNETVTWSTAIRFVINPKYFISPEITISKFKKKLYLIAAKYPHTKLSLNDEPIKSLPMREYVSYMLKYKLPLEKDKLLHVHKELGSFQIDAWFTLDPSKNSTVIGDVNNIICNGTYLTNFESFFANCVNATIPRNKLPRNIIVNGLKAYVSILIKDPLFTSQTKEYMTKSISNYLLDIADHVTNLIKYNKYISGIIDSLVEEYNRKKLARQVKVKRILSTENPAYDSSNIPGEVLYILEGDSALGTLKQIRDINTEGLYPLSGKILNIGKSTDDKIISSKKFKYLLETLGVNFHEKNQQFFRYKSIKILTDADSDGAHIAVLVILTLWRFCRSLIENGNVSVITTPLYGTMQGKKFIPIFTTAERNKYKNITRFKGIGELNPSQLKVIIRDPKYSYTLKPPENESIEKAIIACITDTEVKRAICNSPDINIYNFLEEALGEPIAAQ